MTPVPRTVVPKSLPFQHLANPGTSLLVALEARDLALTASIPLLASTSCLTPLYALVYICVHMQVSTMQTLADPSRFQIVEALLQGEQAVNDLVAKMDIDQSGVSRHLRILGEAGFVRVRPDGPRRLYSLRPEPFRELNAWVSQYRALWEGRLDAFAVALDRRRQQRPHKRRARRKP